VLGIDLGTESRGDNHHENKEVVKELYTAFDRGDARRGRAVNRERDLAPASTVRRSPGHIAKHTRETFDISRVTAYRLLIAQGLSHRRFLYAG
jgi:hypothetical protein